MIRYFFCSLLLFLATVVAYAQPGRVVVVPTFQDQLILTKQGGNYYRYEDTFQFPPREQSFTKVTLVLKLACHDDLGCGKWDYLDRMSITENTEYGTFADGIELLRFVTPYAMSRTADNWDGFSWEVDVTDHEGLLRDEVTLWYKHRGWQESDGWKISVTFHMVEGTPARDLIFVEQIPWTNGKFEVDPPLTFADYNFTIPRDVGAVLLKLYQTGHGNNTMNCAEFCKRTRTITWDGMVVEEKIPWDYCGNVALHPQDGNWAGKRNGWCPGDVVLPDDYLFEVSPGESHTLGMDIQHRGVFEIIAGSSEAFYRTNALLFYYRANNFSHDVAMEAIVTPSTKDQYHRYNPTCGEPVVIIKNMGREVLTSARIKYGIEASGQTMLFEWKGSLASTAQEVVKLPGILDWHTTQTDGERFFVVFVSAPNGKRDENYHNNTMRSEIEQVPVYETDNAYGGIRLSVQANGNSASENWYQVCDVTDNRVMVENHKLPNNTLIEKDIALEKGHCYRLVVSDEGADTMLPPDLISVPEGMKPPMGDGLAYSFTIDGGTRGYVRIQGGKDEEKRKRLSGNFGNRLTHYFVAHGPIEFPETLVFLEEDIVDEPLLHYGKKKKYSSLSVVPNPTSDEVEITAFPAMTRLSMLGVDGQEQFTKTFKGAVRSYKFSTACYKAGVYVLRANICVDGNKEEIRRLIIDG